MARAALLGDSGPPRPVTIPVAADGAHAPGGWSARSATVALPDQARLAARAGASRRRLSLVTALAIVAATSIAAAAVVVAIAATSISNAGRTAAAAGAAAPRHSAASRGAGPPRPGGPAVPGAPGHRVVGAAGLQLGRGQRGRREHRDALVNRLQRSAVARGRPRGGASHHQGRARLGDAPTPSPSRSRSPTTEPPGPTSTRRRPAPAARRRSRSAAPAATSGCTAPSGPPSGGTRCGNSRSSAGDHGRRVIGGRVRTTDRSGEKNLNFQR